MQRSIPLMIAGFLAALAAVGSPLPVPANPEPFLLSHGPGIAIPPPDQLPEVVEQQQQQQQQLSQQRSELAAVLPTVQEDQAGHAVLYAQHQGQDQVQAKNLVEHTLDILVYPLHHQEPDTYDQLKHAANELKLNKTVTFNNRKHANNSQGLGHAAAAAAAAAITNSSTQLNITSIGSRTLSNKRDGTIISQGTVQGGTYRVLNGPDPVLVHIEKIPPPPGSSGSAACGNANMKVSAHKIVDPSQEVPVQVELQRVKVPGYEDASYNGCPPMKLSITRLDVADPAQGQPANGRQPNGEADKETKQTVWNADQSYDWPNLWPPLTRMTDGIHNKRALHLQAGAGGHASSSFSPPSDALTSEDQQSAAVLEEAAAAQPKVHYLRERSLPPIGLGPHGELIFQELPDDDDDDSKQQKGITPRGWSKNLLTKLSHIADEPEVPPEMPTQWRDSRRFQGKPLQADIAPPSAQLLSIQPRDADHIPSHLWSSEPAEPAEPAEAVVEPAKPIIEPFDSVESLESETETATASATETQAAADILALAQQQQQQQPPQREKP